MHGEIGKDKGKKRKAKGERGDRECAVRASITHAASSGGATFDACGGKVQKIVPWVGRRWHWKFASRGTKLPV